MMQEGNRNTIDDYFKEKLFDYEAPAPADIFGKVEDALFKKKRKLWLNITISMAATVAIIIATGLGYLIGTHNSKSHENKLNVAENKYHKPIKNTTNFSKNLLLKNNTNEPFESKENLREVTSNNRFSSPNYVPNSEGSSSIANKSNESIVTKKSNYKSNSFAALTPRTITKLQNKNYAQHLAISEKSIDILLGLDTHEVTTDEESTNHNWQLGTSIAPLYSYRNIQDNNTPESSASFNNFEKPILAYAGGLNINYEKNRWRFESGVYYSRQGQEIKNVLALKTSSIANNFGDQPSVTKDNQTSNYVKADNSNTSVVNSNGLIRSSNTNTSDYVLNNSYISSINTPSKSENTSTASLDQRYDYIEIPFIAHYKLIDRSIELSVSGGMSANIMVGNSIQLSSNTINEHIGKTENVNTFNYSSIIGLAFEVPLRNKFSIRVEPRFRYNINSINTNTDLNTHPYSFGLFSGFAYTF